MKKLLTLTITAILCFGLISSAFAALDADTVWEVRTTGADTNGGGFNSTNASAGTDYSQQDAAQLALTDLAMTTGGTTLTSATGGFTEAMEGNIIQIVSGTNFTAGFYEIVTYTDTNTVTIDRDATNGSNASSGVGNVGGALASPDKAADAVIAGNTVYVESGTYQKLGANTYVFQLNTSGTSSAMIVWEAYQTVRGDSPSPDNSAVIDGNSSATNCLDCNNLLYNVFKNFKFQNATGDNIIKTHTLLFWVNVRSTNAGDCNFEATTNNYGLGQFFGCEIDNASYRGTNTQGWDDYYGGVYVHDNADDGIILTRYNGRAKAEFCVFDSNGDYNADVGGGSAYVWVTNCVFYNATTSELRTNSNLTVVLNSIFKDSGGYSTTGGGNLYIDYCLSHGNTSGNYDGGYEGEHNLTSDPLFTNAAAGDFTVQSGSPVLAAGFDITDYITSLTGPYKPNIGVDQDDNSSGSSEHSYGFVN